MYLTDVVKPTLTLLSPGLSVFSSSTPSFTHFGSLNPAHPFFFFSKV